MEEIDKQYEAETGVHIELNSGATGQLAGQIRSGAPVDVFLSASSAEVDRLANEKAVDGGTRKVVARNRLVLIVPRDSAWNGNGFDGLTASNVRRIAIGQPKTVPAGEYGRQVLENRKLWEQVEKRIVYGANVRQVLDYVERGEVDAGIVYATDAKESGEKVKVVGQAEESWHAPIEYIAVAVTGSAKRAAAIRFLAYLDTKAARAVLQRHGFPVDPPSATKAASP
jgi:molybdate transport system substrate-binding protein